MLDGLLVSPESGVPEHSDHVLLGRVGRQGMPSLQASRIWQMPYPIFPVNSVGWARLFVNLLPDSVLDVSVGLLRISERFDPTLEL